MRRSFAVSLLCHGAAFLLALALVAPAASVRTPPVKVALNVHPDAPDPEILPVPPLELEPPPLPDEAYEAEPEPAPEIEVDAPPVIVACVQSPRGGRATRLLSRPLRVPVRFRPQPPVVAKKTVRRAPTRPKRPAGVSRGARLKPGAGIPYPRQARRRGLEGKVELRLQVDPTGRVLRVEVAVSSGQAVLDRAACEGALSWRFEPALRNGRPVASWVRRAVRFRLAP